MTGVPANAHHQRVHRWATSGVLGDEHRGPGSGRYHQFTAWERWKLDLVSRIGADVKRLGGHGISIAAVGEIWRALDDPACDSLRWGSVLVELDRTGAPR